jgi:hypothetical protein
MTLDKSVQRLSWQFSRGTSFKPNQNDVDALNTVFEWITSQKEINLLNQQLFAKLYIYQLEQTLRYYDSTVFDAMIQKDLSRILDTPLDAFYQAFHKSLHHNQLKKLKIKDGLSLEDIKENYTLEVVKDQLNNMITEAINKFN